MAENSGIQWTDHTFNPWIGCQKVSPGCDNCYAEEWDNRFRAGRNWGPHGERERTSVANWRKPVKWNRDAFYECLSCRWRGPESASKACEHGYDYPHRHCPNCNTTESLSPARCRVFCASMADVFDNQADPEWRAYLWSLIRATPNLDWLLLTKRPENIAGMLPPDWGAGWPGVWLGVSAEDQKHADHRIPVLLNTPAALRWVSAEPLLGPVDFTNIKPPTSHIGDGVHGWSAIWKGNKIGRSCLDWIVTGGESGAHARPFDIGWARSIIDQCRAAQVPVFVKQLGKRPFDGGMPDGHVYQDANHNVICRIHDPKGGNSDEWPADLRVREFPTIGVPHDQAPR